MSHEAPPPLVQALDAFVDVLSRITDETPGVDHGFYDGLCAAICRQTSVDRAVIFRYDGAHRRVRAAGSSGVDLDIFDGVFVSVEVLGEARRALEDDVVVETRSFAGIPEQFEPLVHDRVLVVAPMVAAGRWIGVVVGDRPADAPPLEDAERHLLWTLGKTAALAAMARIATSQAHRARELEERIDMARDIHDGAIQRLFGVSLALAGEGDLDAASRARASDELQAALQDLRDAVQPPAEPLLAADRDDARRGARRAARRSTRTSGSCSRRAIRRDVPPELEALAQSVFVEAIRNAQKHAHPRRVARPCRPGRRRVRARRDQRRGPRAARAARPGWACGSPALEALQQGGVVEFGRSGPGAWQVRLVVPNGH